MKRAGDRQNPQQDRRIDGATAWHADRRTIPAISQARCCMTVSALPFLASTISRPIPICGWAVLFQAYSKTPAGPTVMFGSSSRSAQKELASIPAASLQ
jgi:hypothetical protein